MKKFLEILFICLFGIFTVSIGYLTVARNTESYSYYENRNLASLPSYSAETAADGSYFSAIETHLSDHAFARNTMMKLKIKSDLVLGRPVVNEIVITDDALLPYYNYRSYDIASTAREAAVITENLKSVKECTEENGGEFVFMAVPTQSMLFEGAYPDYLNDAQEYVAQIQETLLPQLEAAGVTCIDLDSIYRSLNKTEAVRSAIDHHYNLEGAYIAYRSLMDTLSLETDVLTEDEFTYVSFPNHTIGSRSKKIYDMTDIDEPFSYMELKTPIAFTRTDYGTETSPTVYAMPENQWTPLEYLVYMGGDVANTVIDTNRPTMPTILVYGDSFTNAFETIVYYSFDETHALDFRHLSDVTLEEYITAVKPDVVVCIRDYNALLSPEGNGQGAYGTN